MITIDLCETQFISHDIFYISGVPRLKRSELEAACEEFSNVIGSASLCTLYKGTLSSGVEIAVASIAVGSPKQWSTSMEAQFRKKVPLVIHFCAIFSYI